MFYSFYVLCILISFINTPRFQITYNCIDLSRYSSERINLFFTISYGKYCFTFRTNSCRPGFWNELCSISEVLILPLLVLSVAEIME